MDLIIFFTRKGVRAVEGTGLETDFLILTIIMESTQLKGALTEQKCFLKCIESGFVVSKPLFDNARYDFILDVGSKLLRIQVKTSAWVDDTHSSFNFNGYSQHSIGSGNKRMKYTNKEIDYFMTEKENQYYLYPASEEGFSVKALRLLPPKSGQTKNISWAKDYLFEKVIQDF